MVASQLLNGRFELPCGPADYTDRVTVSSAATPPAALLTRTDALAELLCEVDPRTPIPTCPGWVLADLVTHVGRAQRWAATMIIDRATDELDTRAVPDGARPKETAAAARWLSEGARLVCAAVDATGADTPVWTTLGTAQPAAWWLRRLTHEVTVHHADALLALGRPVTVEPDLAADAICEWLDLLSIGTAGRTGAVLPDGATLHLHATDPGLGLRGEWIVRHDGSSIVWEHGHAKATTAVRASASTLLLALLGRHRPGDPNLEIFGEPAVFAHWIDRTPF